MFQHEIRLHFVTVQGIFVHTMNTSENFNVSETETFTLTYENGKYGNYILLVVITVTMLTHFYLSCIFPSLLKIPC